MSEHFPCLKIHGNKYVKFSILLMSAQILASTRVPCGDACPLLNPIIPEGFELEGTKSQSHSNPCHGDTFYYIPVSISICAIL